MREQTGLFDYLVSTQMPSQFVYRVRPAKAKILKLLLRTNEDIAVCHRAFQESFTVD